MVTIPCVFVLCLGIMQHLEVEGQVRRNNEPLNIGFIFSLPYDISNTLRAPLGGPLSLILGAGLALIMFFGMLAAPLYYIFGIPPRSYHIRDAEKNATLDSDFFSRRSFDKIQEEVSNIDENGRKFSENYPNLIESAFLLIPVKQTECRLLMLCHAHGFLPWLPIDLVKFYRFFSQRITKVDAPEHEALIIGLEDQDQCSKVFDQCPLDIVTIGKLTFNNVVTQIIN